MDEGLPLHDRPYARLRRGYATRQAAVAALAYHLEAVYVEDYPGGPLKHHQGRAAIERLFAAFFAEVLPQDPAVPVDLNFRFTRRDQTARGTHDQGVYRLRIGPECLFGRFDTRVQEGLFWTDRSQGAGLVDFESAPGEVLFDPDEEGLEGAFFDQLLGAYGDDKTLSWVITRSARRLYARHVPSGVWRGLNRASGTLWTAGAAVIDSTTTTATFRFDLHGDTPTLSVEGPEPKEPVQRRRHAYRLEPVQFTSGAVSLHGQIYNPLTITGRRPAIALVHGSGPQDRHGYASVIGLLADHLARLGLVVLTYDKRGVYASTGDWAQASFTDLAEDAASALAVLRGRSDVDADRVGLGGSSQAGWVAAAAVSLARTDFVFLLGAAGAALTVEAQNLYNTGVRLACAGVPTDDIALALTQQRAYFQARRDGSFEAELARATRRAQTRPALRSELFPATLAPRATPEWFDVLDVDFDPLQVWANYARPALFLFGSNDDSTPTAQAQQRLATLEPDPRRTVAILEGAQHLGLLCESTCAGDLERVSRFHPRLFETISKWVSRWVLT